MMIDVGEWTPVRSPKGRLICYINRQRGLLKWRDGDDTALVDLLEFLGVMRGTREETVMQEQAPQ